MKWQFNNDDSIDDIFRRELKDHRVPPPKDNWSNISTRLAVKRSPLPKYLAAASLITFITATAWWGFNHLNNANTQATKTYKASTSIRANSSANSSLATSHNIVLSNNTVISSNTNSEEQALTPTKVSVSGNNLVNSNMSLPAALSTLNVEKSTTDNTTIQNGVSSVEVNQNQIALLQSMPGKQQTALMPALPALTYDDAILSKQPAQIATLNNKNIKGFYVGINGSVKNVWILDHVALNEKNFNYSITPGFAYGIQGGYNFSDNFGLETGLTLNARNGQNYTLYLDDITPENKSVVLNYAEIPVMVKFKIPQIAPFTGMPIVLNLNVGLSYSYLRSAYTFESGDKTGSQYQYPTNQLSALAGFSYDIYTNHPYSFSFGFVAQYGLNTVNNEGNLASGATSPLSQFPNGSDFGKPHNLSMALNVAINYNFSLFHHTTTPTTF